MKENRAFISHASAVSALFILGNSIIKAPLNGADEFVILAYIAVIPVSVLLYIPIIYIADLFYGEKSTERGVAFKFLQGAVFLSVSIFSLFIAVNTFMDYVDFIRDVILSGASYFSIIIIFGLICAFFGFKRQEDVMKFALISFWFVSLLMLFFFFAALPNYGLRNIFIFRLPDFKNFTAQTLPFVKNPVLPSLLLPIYSTLIFKKQKKSSLFSGYFMGSVLLGLGILSSVLLFGTRFAGNLDFPYSSAVSTVSIGRLFTRLDGFSYYIYFAAAIIRINVCVFIVSSSLKKLCRLLH